MRKRSDAGTETGAPFIKHLNGMARITKKSPSIMKMNPRKKGGRGRLFFSFLFAVKRIIHVRVSSVPAVAPVFIGGLRRSS